MTMATIRRLHYYIGMFIAPSVLFFAMTGAWQLFSLHEAHGDYVPLPIIEKLSSVHKDQVFALGHHNPPRPAAASPGPAGASPPDDDDDGVPLPTLILKIFFLIVALGLIASTFMGLWIGLTRSVQKRAGWALLLAGAATPVVLLIV